MNPRKPTGEEKKEIVEYLISEGYGMGTVSEEVVEKDLAAWVADAAIAVFDNYSTDSPGYRGKVMVVVWRNGVEASEVFVWREGKLEKVVLRS